MEEMKEPIVLGWTRDEKGNVVDRHPVEVANAVTAAKRDNTQNYVVEKVAEIHPGQNGAIYSTDGVAPTICAGEGIKTRTKIVEPVNTDDGVCRTIKRQYQQTSRANLERQDTMGATGVTDGVRIRKLTPRECFRLMGVNDRDIDKIQAAGISKSQQYKMAGNSIVVNTLAAIFKNLFDI